MSEIKLSIIAESLGKDIENLGDDLIAAIHRGFEKIARQAVIRGKELADTKLKTTRDDYKNALDYEQPDSQTYMVVLRGKHANAVEDGYCVLFNPKLQKRLQPKILTDKGNIPLTDLKIGDKVLNKNGKFTEVLAIHINSLFDNYQMQYVKSIKKSTTYNNKHHRYYDGFKCNSCHLLSWFSRCDTQKYYKKNKIIHCPLCIKQIYYVKIIMPNNKNLLLTPEHYIWTSTGYKMAKDLTIKDKIAYVYNNICQNKNCNNPANKQYCSKSCATKINMKKCLIQGTHNSQQIGSRGQWHNKMALIRKNGSQFEHNFENIFKQYNIKYVKQFPIRVAREDGIKTVYRIDFYLPKYKIAIEIDGKFHDKPKAIIHDKLRDHRIQILGVETIRIHWSQWNINKYNCIDQIIRRINNHNNKYRPIFIAPTTIKQLYVNNGFNTPFKFDITVKNDSSYVCQGMVIHNSGFSMKEGLLKNSKRIGPGGRYNIIPFYYSPRSKQNFGQLKNKLNQEVEKIARSKGLKKTFREEPTAQYPKGKPRQGTVWRMPKDFKIGKPLFRGHPDPQLEYLRGLTKIQKTYKVATQGYFMTFRTVSDSSEPGSWFHPKWDGAKIWPLLEDFVEREATELVKSLLT